MRLRSVSELVSAALLGLIAITIGGFVVALLVSQLSQQQSMIQEQLVKNIFETRQEVSIAFAYVSGTNVVAVAVTGDTPTSIDAVYIDGQLASCTLSLTNGTTISLGSRIPPYTAVVIRCPVSTTGAHVVRIVYPGGSTTALAQ